MIEIKVFNRKSLGSMKEINTIKILNYLSISAFIKIMI